MCFVAEFLITLNVVPFGEALYKVTEQMSQLGSRNVEKYFSHAWDLNAHPLA